MKWSSKNTLLGTALILYAAHGGGAPHACLHHGSSSACGAYMHMHLQHVSACGIFLSAECFCSLKTERESASSDVSWGLLSRLCMQL